MKGNYEDYSSDSDYTKKEIQKKEKNYDISKLKNVNLDYDLKMNSSNRIIGNIKNIDKQEYNRSLRIKDRSDRATVEQVIDGRISRILYKLINKGEITEINGCISTGKEANVYYAKGTGGSGDNKELAVKIYKTSILIFKDRDRYISGEFRFRHGYCRSNPRKMVALWAEKEVRNLKRLNLSGIKSPVPLILKSNLIVMEFIGKNEKAAPRLKDAKIESQEEWDFIYLSIIRILRTMFKECRLVHADFSEYNLLYYEREIYVIDVGQAVEDFHPNALNFLKRDCHNVNLYFDKNGVETITDHQLFEIVSTFDIEMDLEDYVEKYREENLPKIRENAKFKEIENGLFSNFEIPRSMMEEDVDKINDNEDIADALFKLCGIVHKEEEKEKMELEIKKIQKRKKEKKEIKEKINNENNDNDNNENKDKDLIILDDNINDENEYDNDTDSEINDDFESEESIENIEVEEGNDENKNNDNDNKDLEGKESEKKIEKKKKNFFDPFEGLSKQERKKKVKEENREKRANKKFTKYEKAKQVKKTSGKR